MQMCERCEDGVYFDPEYGEMDGYCFCPDCGRPITEPKALTLEELRERDGRPVWVKYLTPNHYEEPTNDCWGILGKSITEKIGVWWSDDHMMVESDYAKYWLAYDHPPKEGPRRENTRKTCATCKSLYVKDFAVGTCNHPGSGKTTVQPKDGCECWEERL